MLVAHPPHLPIASTMSSKRIPLANNPNAANSPFRNATAKRSRAQVEGKDAENVYSPPKKKQLIGIEGNGTRRAQHISPDDREGRVFLGKADGAASNAFVRKLAAAREARQPQPQPRPAGKESKPHVADVDTIKQWRKHYRKVFPTFVFYFESLPADISAKSSKQIQSLGAVRCVSCLCSHYHTNMKLARGKVLLKSGHPHCHHSGYPSQPRTRCKQQWTIQWS